MKPILNLTKLQKKEIVKNKEEIIEKNKKKIENELKMKDCKAKENKWTTEIIKSFLVI